MSLTISEGEFVALMGASGSGKSTLLNIVGTLDRATAGSVCVGGVDVSTCGERKLTLLRRDGIGFIFQQFHLIPGLTAEENVAIPLQATRSLKRRRSRRAWELLTEVGLADKLRSYPHELSGGEQQRVAVARALARSPRLLIADEPTGNLDRPSGEGVLELLESMRARRGTTVLLATHDPLMASKADRVIGLRDGRVACDRAVSTLEDVEAIVHELAAAPAA